MTWLDVADLSTLLGEDLVGDADDDALQSDCDAAREWVEDKRRDLVDDQGTFVAGARVRLGAAMLAWRWYARRTSPLGVIGATEDGFSGMLRDDPDVAMLLGIGRRGRFTFGGRRPVVDEAV